MVVVPRLPAQRTASTGSAPLGNGSADTAAANSASESVNLEPRPLPSAPAPNPLPTPDVGGDEVQTAEDPEEAFHHDLPDTPTLYAPCSSDHGPADTDDAGCVARWAVFHLVTDQLSEVSAWIDPAVLGQQRTSVAREIDPAEVLVWDAQSGVDQIGPARAQVQVVVERTWPTGQVEHLYFTTVLVLDGADERWRLISLERQ